MLLISLSAIILFSCGNSENIEGNDTNLFNKTIEINRVEESIKEENSKLVDQNILQGKLSILLPDYFAPMSQKLVEIKYPSGNRPSEIYCNASGSVSLGFSYTENLIQVEKLPEILPSFVQQFSNMYPTIKWYKKEMTKINNVDYILFEFETPAIDTEIYNLMAITELDGRMLISTFNCTVGLKPEWETQANQIIQSLKLK